MRQGNRCSSWNIQNTTRNRASNKTELSKSRWNQCQYWSFTWFHRYLEMFLGVPLQWDICILHLKELPLRHIFMKIDGTTKGPDKFSEAIGSQLNGNVSKWGCC